ncbi:MAG TPA: hypothetical protein VFZ99_01235 [Terriglobales bacterium]
MSDEVELLTNVYASFNGRDIERVLAAMHPDVVWANGMEGGPRPRTRRSAQLLETSMGAKSEAQALPAALGLRQHPVFP